MTLYEYRGKKIDGQAISGTVQAGTKEEAVEILSRQGILPICVNFHNNSFSDQAKRFTRRVSFNEIYTFTYQLSNLLKSGVPVLRAMKIIHDQIANDRFRKIVDSIQQSIKDGRSFSDCLQEYPEVFSSLYVSMVRAGEEGGNLQSSLYALASYQKAQREIFSKIRTALAYPLFMACTGVITVIFILLFVMPKITGLFDHIGQDLPLLTQVLIFSSDFFRKTWFVALPAVSLLLLLLIRWYQSKKGKNVVDQFLLKVPLIKDLIHKAEFSRFAKTLELLLRSGIPLVKAIDISAATIENQYIQKDFSQCRSDLEQGKSLGQSFDKCKFIPPMVMPMILVGEESGFIEDTLGDISNTYQQETSEMIKTFTIVLEPIMILVVGLIVGVVIMAMLLPVFQMDILVQ